MRAWTCAATGRRLEAFHDGELSVRDQIAVESHLEWCDRCAARCAEMRAIGAALRRAVPGRASLDHEMVGAFTATVVHRATAERDASLQASIVRMFDDMRLVYAALGGVVAVLVCGVITLSTMRFAVDERPDTPALAMPVAGTSDAGSRVAIDDEVRTRWIARLRQAREAAAEDAVFALAAVVTRNGRVAMLTRSHLGHAASREEARLIEGLLNGLARARFEPALDERVMPEQTVWLITRTTVRATKKPTA